ncbi:unnamed protein product [Paramecium sonneborni]|uniref:Transmembrane protein n=1 Tax=Paramecium sonneborni TaxID=65129 RepID=A0A8S1LP08_9CILI|nr:unnamed protein product [Paramecium sonneborni]
MEVNSGYLFQESEEQIINKRCTSSVYTYSKDYYHKLYQKNFDIYEPIASITLEMDISVMYVRNQYPTISEVLASIGSIIQILLLIRYLFYALNRNQLNQYMKSAILANYYPEWKDIKMINKNKIKTCILDDKKIKITSIQKFENEINEMHHHQDIHDFNMKNEWSQFEDYRDAINQNHLDPFLFSYHWKIKNQINSFNRISSFDNEQLQKQNKSTQKQDNPVQMVDELRNQDSKSCIEIQDQIIQD